MLATKLELLPLDFKLCLLARGETVSRVDRITVGILTFEHHEPLVIENQIGPLIELREHCQGVFQFVARRQASASPVAAIWHSSTRRRTSLGRALPTPVIAPTAPQRTKPWNTCVSTPTIRASDGSPLVILSAA